MKRKTLTPEQRERIYHLRAERGWSFKRIAADLDVSPSSVTWYCLIHCVEKAGGPPAVKPLPREKYNYTRNGKPVRAFTEEEDRLLLQMDLEGLNYSEMGRRLGRKHNSIQGRMATLARLEERKAEAVEK